MLIFILYIPFVFMFYRKYKNAIKHDPGINVKVLDWMDKVFQERGATAFERIGGLLFDETTIQVTGISVN